MGRWNYSLPHILKFITQMDIKATKKQYKSWVVIKEFLTFAINGSKSIVMFYF